ncbi:MAG: hypothetical protein PWQ12_905 [Clostridiales bacterium]|jgi:hypothetical protein|nr:hypothetical protein [Clostridiales bacterium]
MIQSKETITAYFEENFDLDRIRTLPITDKFKLINYIKLVGFASVISREKDLESVKESAYYEMDSTFYLLLSLISSGVSADVISQIIEAYCANFEDSDIFYAKLVILGVGALMIQQGIDRDSIIGYLILLLGESFLRQNYERIHAERDELEITDENQIKISFKNFDYTYRKMKYDMLALLKIKREQGHEKVRDLIFNHYGDKNLKLYFRLIDLKEKSISNEIFSKLMADSPNMDRFLVMSCRCIVEEWSILEMHYLLNAIIGKYTRFNKPYSEVMAEIEVHEKEILSM